MMKGLLSTTLKPVQKICLSGLFIAVVTVLQKVLAINYIPIIPFLRISLGGPAMIIFSSIFLGPVYGFFIGAASDVLGYFILDPKMLGYFPQITAIYGLMGLLSFFIFWLFRLVKRDKLLFFIEGLVFAFLIAVVAVFLGMSTNLQLYSSTYSLLLWQKITIPCILFVLLSGLFVSSILFNRKYKKDSLPISPISISFSCFIIELIVMVIFGSLMKGWAFGFKTYPMILLCQIIVMFVNVPLNTWLIILMLRLINRYYKEPVSSI